MKLIKTILLLIITLSINFSIYLSITCLKKLSYFNINKIIVHGNKYLGENEILGKSQISLGENIFNIDLLSINNCLIKHHWIKEAIAKRDLPDTILLLITEREPVAYIEKDKSLYLVDREGYLIETVSKKEYNYPLLKVVTTKKLDVGEYLDSDTIDSAMKIFEILNTLPSESTIRLSSLTVFINDQEEKLQPEFIITTDNGINLKIGKDNFSNQLPRLQKLWSDIINHNDINYIDLRFDDRIVINYQ